ncbi:MAG TPA: hypothetical protein VIL49_01205 [Capillimicrobium sp.]|jgi:hypothetical protein
MHARPLAAAAAAAAALVAIAVGPASAGTAPPPAEVSGDGIGAVTLGASYQQLRDAGLITRMTEGCELAGPGTRAASLRRPLAGGVDFTRRGTPRVRNVYATKGAEARGIGIGDRMRALRRAFPGAVVDRSTEETFQATLVRIPRSEGGRFEFLVDTKDRRVEAIGVPGIAFCE